jgi:hypothetical protein
VKFRLARVAGRAGEFQVSLDASSFLDTTAWETVKWD